MPAKIHRNAIRPGHRLHWYRIDSILGQGGFGITYLAHDLNLDEQVAIKEYLPVELAVREGDCSVNPLSEDHGEMYQDGLQQFISEARTLSRFRHPNIVRVRSVFEENNTAYMVMDYEEGETLKDLLSGGGSLDEYELLGILVPLLGGLEHVHAAGYIHRDIKPANVFIRRDGSPVLLDFGSARQALGTETRTLTSLVSPGFAPLEQYCARSNAQGPWTDIYGLGATLYRAVTGRAPLDALDRNDSVSKSSGDLFIPASDLAAGRYSRRFLNAIDHALAFRREDRPSSVGEWRREFDMDARHADRPVLEDATTVFNDQPETERVSPPAAAPSGRVRARALAAGLFAALAVSTAGMALVKGDAGTAPPPADVMDIHEDERRQTEPPARLEDIELILV